MSEQSGLATALSVARYQYSNLPINLTADSCAGKTYIITGANIGLGLECTKHLVKLGAKRVIVAVRSRSRGNEAVSAIEAETGIRGVAEVWDLDLASYQSTLAFARRVEAELERVDAIVEGAVAASTEWTVSEGLETSITVNVVATMLLAVLLMPHLKACAKRYNIQPSIVIITSVLAFARQVDLPKIDKHNILRDLSDDKKWTMEGSGRYGLSKLLLTLAFRRLSALVPVSETGVVINSVDPGICKTGLSRYVDKKNAFAVGILRAAMGRSAEWGSRNYLAGIAAGEKSHGKYVTYCDIREEWVPGWLSNKEGKEWCERVWNEVATELERVQPGCVEKALKEE